MPTSQRKKSKSNLKEPLPLAERIRRHFKSLVAQTEGGHIKNAIKTCDKILVLEPNDPDALQTKLALLLHTEKYASALALAETLIEEARDTEFSLEFGKAYALYRLNREPDASEVVRHIKPKGEYEERSVMHMEAQIEYRRGNYQKAQDLYSQIFDTSLQQSDERSDSLTNLTASQAHLDFLQTGFLRSLHTLPQTVSNSLEEAPPPVIVSPHPVLATAPSQQQQHHHHTSVIPKKKVRTSRIPKGVIPGVTPTPDPERWIKKSERTNVHHHGGKRRKGTTGGATQGSLVEGRSKNKGKKK